MKLRIVFYAMRFFSWVESLLLARRPKSEGILSFSSIGKEGYEYGSSDLTNLLSILKIEKRVPLSNFTEKIIIQKESLIQFAQEILKNEEIRDRLSRYSTGKFSCDFITFYRTLPLPKEQKDQQFYANHWHTDSLLTSNCVKIFLLPELLDSDQGPFKAFDLDSTRQLQRQGFFRGGRIPDNVKLDNEPLVFDGSLSRALLSRTNVCMHAAGIPVDENHRDQLMIQLNPSKHWGYREDLYEVQYEREPTLAFIKNRSRPQVVYPS